MPHDIVSITFLKNTQHTFVRSVLARAMPFVLVGSKLLDFWTRIISHTPDYEIFYVVVFHFEQPWKIPNVNWIELLFMLGRHRLQKPTRFVGLPTKRKISPKTDENMGNSGTATAVPAQLYPGRRPCLEDVDFKNFVSAQPWWAQNLLGESRLASNSLFWPLVIEKDAHI